MLMVKKCMHVLLEAVLSKVFIRFCLISSFPFFKIKKYFKHTCQIIKEMITKYYDQYTDW